MAQKSVHYHRHNYDIAYEIVHPAARKDILFLHGWGSNKEIMKGAFAKHLNGYRHIYIDLPGFGKSPNDTVLTTKDYAAITAAFLEAIGSTPDIVAGHSFGGKVATLLSPPTLVLLSSAGIPLPKPPGVRARIALFKALNRVGLGRFRRYFVSDDARGMGHAMYETFKNVVDEDFTALFAAYDRPALLFWGTTDTATPLGTGERIAALMGHAKLFPMEGDHFFFSHHAAAIAQIIEREFHG